MSIESSKRLLAAFLELVREDRAGDLFVFIEHKLIPLLRDEPLLMEEYKRRVHYYEQLAHEPRFNALITRIHSRFPEIHQIVIPKKLPNTGAGVFNKVTLVQSPTGNDIQPSFPTLKDLHGFLAEPSRWYRLGKIPSGPDREEDDSLFPWRNVLKQYEAVASLLESAMTHKACKRSPKKIIASLNRDISELRGLLEKPWQRWHIGSFEWMHRMLPFMSRLPGEEDKYEFEGEIIRRFQRSHRVLAEDAFKEARHNVEMVCQELLLFLEQQEGTTASHVQDSIEIHGVSIDIARRTVTFKGYAEIYQASGTPWKVFRICAMEEPDGIGRAALDHLRETKDALHRKLHRINKKWRDKTGHSILRVEGGYIYIDPRRVQV